MKKAIGIGLLMLTGITAFAAPAAAYEMKGGRTTVVKKEVIVHNNRRVRGHRVFHIEKKAYRR